ncbi:hypothetical protein [Streptomyces luteolus]|uniref:Uncharacterized protein n=1 Tax=Streptomyces luteolus TaxID=3043615 RepID=A0ABT6T1L6_9ACTN|nr:hypothetical protein [Streptomyces sp. B-S-A12]MDI3421758.1 hypothetical protein [Streptomyces sp. B-S-A12]
MRHCPVSVPRRRDGWVDRDDQAAERRDGCAGIAKALDLEHPLLPQRALDVLQQHAVQLLLPEPGAAVLGVELGERGRGEVGAVVLRAPGGQDDAGTGG